MNGNKTFFAPQLFIKSGVHNIDFYKDGLGAIERRRWDNDDGSIHVAELSIDGAIFHLHEENIQKRQAEPNRNNSVTTLIGIFVSDVDAMMHRAVKAGAEEVSPAKSYDYGYRQGEIRDPFGHLWLIQQEI
jgi:PhnB protein